MFIDTENTIHAASNIAYYSTIANITAILHALKCSNQYSM